MKKNIEAPVVKIMQFVEQDVIATSGENPVDGGNVDNTKTADGMGSPFRGQSPTNTGW